MIQWWKKFNFHNVFPVKHSANELLQGLNIIHFLAVIQIMIQNAFFWFGIGYCHALCDELILPFLSSVWIVAQCLFIQHIIVSFGFHLVQTPLSIIFCLAWDNLWVSYFSTLSFSECQKTKSQFLKIKGFFHADIFQM